VIKGKKKSQEMSTSIAPNPQKSGDGPYEGWTGGEGNDRRKGKNRSWLIYLFKKDYLELKKIIRTKGGSSGGGGSENQGRAKTLNA